MNTNTSQGRDAVPEALRVFVESARLSGNVYSVAQLREMVRAEVMQEAGGFISWFKRSLTGVDNSVADEIRADLASLRTERDRQTLLRFIDRLISEVSEYLQRGNIGQGIRTGASALIAIPLMKDLVKSLTPDGRKNVVAHMADIADSREQNLTASQHQRMANGRTLVVGAVGLYATYRLAANIFRIINRSNGSAQEYMDALIQLRAEVAAAPLVD